MWFLISIFFYNAPAPPEIYTLSLHDALPISDGIFHLAHKAPVGVAGIQLAARTAMHGNHLNARLLRDRKSTRLNSSHVEISYAVFCLKKKIRTGQCLLPLPSPLSHLLLIPAA